MKPILFNTEMVRAILEGRKTVTRRAIKPQPIYSHRDGFSYKGHAYGTDLPPTIKGAGYNLCCATPYKVGDVLYVRETWGEWTDGYLYKAWDSPFPQPGESTVMKWHPSIHMPKVAARIFLKVTDVRVERLRDITEAQAVKEGCQAGFHEYKGAVFGDEDTEEWTAIDEFTELWNSTIKEDQLNTYGYEANPYVWVIEFEKITKEAADE